MELANIQPVLDWIAQNPGLAWLIIFIIAAGESLALVGIVVPGVVFMLGIGALVGLNAIDLWHALIFAALGAVAGDAVSYWLGRHFDEQLRHMWPLSRYPKLIPKGEKFFKRHGSISILFGRFVGPLRPIIPAVAGIMHMPQGKFYAINVLSAVLWAPVVILPGVVFGESLQLASEVFGKLIIVIILLIVFGVALFYLFKFAFAYTLMVSMEALADFFGLRNARDSVVSLSLMGVLAGSLIFFVYQYEIRFYPVASKQQATDYVWWDKNWQRFSKTHVKYQVDHPVVFQWWGELNGIKQALAKANWVNAARLNMKNSLNYFLPQAEITKLPAIANKLFNKKDALIMVANSKNLEDYLVLRVWAANPNVVRTDKQLWLGTVYVVSIFSPFELMHIPVPQSSYSESISRFASSLVSLGSGVRVRKKQYANIGISDNWRGEVLLVEFNNSL